MFKSHTVYKYTGINGTPQPLYDTSFGVKANFHVSYPNQVISRLKYVCNIGKKVLNSHFWSNRDPCYIQNCVTMNRVIKRFWCPCCNIKDHNGRTRYAIM